MPKPLPPRIFEVPTSLLQQVRDIRIVFLDVDGVLTDGGLSFTADGESLKRFNTLDGHGIKLLIQAGITPAVITGRDSQPLRLRLKQLGIHHAIFGTEEKLTAAQALLEQLSLSWHQAAAMGDDWPDIPVMRRSAFACAPRNAHAENLSIADWVTPSVGGHGAVRDLCDLLLHANDKYLPLLQHYYT